MESVDRAADPSALESRGRDLRGTWLQALLSLFGALAFILSIRWALFEPYVIPSGSMIPSLLIHDHIMVNKFAYGLRVPFTSTWLVHFGAPHRGDVIVFRSVDDDEIFLVKRVVGLPGDEVRVVGKGQLMLNGQLVPRRELSQIEARAALAKWPEEARNDALARYAIYDEDLEGHHHLAFRDRAMDEPITEAREQGPYQVGSDELFMMGDNRDNSADSRVWGPLPEARVLGRATFIWLSCEETLPEANQLCDPQTMRWDRLFRSIR